MSTTTDVHSHSILRSHAGTAIKDISDTTPVIKDGSAAAPAASHNLSPGTSLLGSNGASLRQSLKLWPISDLHLAKGEGWIAENIPDADVAIVAGDICEGVVDAVTWLSAHIRPHMKVVFVPGNHEYYGCVHNEALLRGNEAAAKADIHLLDGNAVVIGDVRFTGATLWTDYNLFGDAFRTSVMQTARIKMNDHRFIHWSKQPWQRFRPQEAMALHHKALLAVESNLVQRHDRPTVVVSHHAPHSTSVRERFGSDLLAGAYASDLSELINRTGPDLWEHGHTHVAVDYRVARTRILSNPRGYRHERARTGFDPSLVVEI
jgi:Icc-related predicted phosphoesterase